MAKKIDGYIKLQIPAGQANPSPPVGPALGQKGVNIMEFCKALMRQHKNLSKECPYQLPLQFIKIKVSRMRQNPHQFLFL